MGNKIMKKNSLTVREIEVAKLMLKGYSNQKLADELSITLSTSKAHVSSIMGKLGAKNRVEAVVSLLKLGY